MEFWLKKSNSDKIMLPVNPESFAFTEKHNNTSVNVNSIGEVNLLGKRDLKTGTISSHFPKRDRNYANNSGRQAPYTYINKLLSWKSSGKPVRLIITGTKINFQVTIETLKYGEQDGTGDVYYDLTLKEYRAVEIKKTKLKKKKKTTKKKSKPKRPAAKKKTKTYTVKSGDCLWNIAKRFYGNGAQYTKIYNANRGKIKNPNLIYPGQVLTIP
ncbi:LysM peptidoglycan-binding domain-containing protein [Ruminococcus sp. OM08-7]|nr:LysM peptidoglycan-binding domain-containing protein [Ruminococcus sp. OM08-7]UWG13971.1 MAG: hypothetical protein [Bacteriophage sp.]UWH97032.1 MAG: hypothetical protein [Bacteriophage sp.]